MQYDDENLILNVVIDVPRWQAKTKNRLDIIEQK